MKQRLIDANELIRTINQTCSLKVVSLSNLVDIIEKQPAIDAAPVARCKDCKHRKVNEHFGEEGYLGIKAMCDLDTGDVFERGRNAEDDDWFCADGERRDNETDRC